MMILYALGRSRAWPYDESRDLAQGPARRPRASGATARAGQRPAEENQEGLRP
jgi:hypothetical protein